MRKTFILTALCLFFLNGAYAQNQRFGHLTIFSEDGDKFTLILNGETINVAPQANLRVEDLTQPYYNAKIIFEDASRLEISKNNLLIADVDGEYQDVTYKIKRDRNNPKKMKLNFFSMTDVDRGFLPASNVHVIHYGAPQPAASTTVTQTTTTTGGGMHNSNMGVGVNVNGVGVGVNISVNEPIFSGVTQTTTTTSSSTSSTGAPITTGSGGCHNGYCMTSANFAAALQSVKNQSFDDTRLKSAKQIASSNCLTPVQIAKMCAEFGFEETKLEFAKFAYNSCTEPQNYFKVNDVFSFSSSVDELNEFISGQ